jgi:hypothetical protein
MVPSWVAVFEERCLLTLLVAAVKSANCPVVVRCHLRHGCLAVAADAAMRVGMVVSLRFVGFTAGNVLTADGSALIATVGRI